MRTAIAAVAPAILVKSRERATWPCSLAFCLLRGVACSVLLDLSSAISMRQVKYSICKANRVTKKSFEQ